MADTGILAQVDYTSRDYTGYRESLLAYATQVFPEWTSRSPADFGVMLVEMFSYLGDIVSFYQDRIQDEAYLLTATQRSSVVAIARQLGYEPHVAIPASGIVTLAPAPGQTTTVTVPAGTRVITSFMEAYDSPLVYETAADAVVSAAAGSETNVKVVEGRTQGSRLLSLYPDSDTTTGVSVLVEDIGVSDGKLSQDFTLAQGPVLLDTVRVFVDDGVAGDEWVRRQDFLLADADAQIFTAFTDDRGTTHVVFGDGSDGAIPPPGLRICAAYRTGGGAYGNIPSGRIRDFSEALSGVEIKASSSMAGGADAESTEQIRGNAPRLFRTLGRAVSAKDYADLALAVPGIGDAKAVAVSASSVTIFVLGPNNNMPTQAQRDAVVRYVSARSLAGVVVTVANGALVRIDFSAAGTPPTLPVLLQVLPRYRRDTVRLAVEKAMQRLFSPSATTFGSRVSLSQVYRRIQSVPGVDWAQIQLMRRSDQTFTSTADIVCRDFEIPVLGFMEIVAAGGV